MCFSHIDITFEGKKARETKTVNKDYRNSLKANKYIKRASVVLRKLTSLTNKGENRRKKNKDNGILSIYINGEHLGLGLILHFT